MINSIYFQFILSMVKIITTLMARLTWQDVTCHISTGWVVNLKFTFILGQLTCWTRRECSLREYSQYRKSKISCGSRGLSSNGLPSHVSAKPGVFFDTPGLERTRCILQWASLAIRPDGGISSMTNYSKPTMHATDEVVTITTGAFSTGDYGSFCAEIITEFTEHWNWPSNEAE